MSIPSNTNSQRNVSFTGIRIAKAPICPTGLKSLVTSAELRLEAFSDITQ